MFTPPGVPQASYNDCQRPNSAKSQYHPIKSKSNSPQTPNPHNPHNRISLNNKIPHIFIPSPVTISSKKTFSSSAEMRIPFMPHSNTVEITPSPICKSPSSRFGLDVSPNYDSGSVSSSVVWLIGKIVRLIPDKRELHSVRDSKTEHSAKH